MIKLFLLLWAVLIISISIMYGLTFILAYNCYNKILVLISYLIGLIIFIVGIILVNNAALNLEFIGEINYG